MAKKKSVLDTLASEIAVEAPVAHAAPIAAPARPETVATRHIGGQWEPFVPGQVGGPGGVIGIKFADGSEWHLGKGWLK